MTMMSEVVAIDFGSGNVRKMVTTHILEKKIGSGNIRKRVITHMML